MFATKWQNCLIRIKKIKNSQKNKNSEHWGKSDKTIVFTNGCFDLLHKGHKDFLFKASKFGNKLIIGVNSDASVKKIKGKSRPIENQDIRKRNLLNLKYVDSVFIFEESTPMNLIKKICPDVLVKGADYEVNEIIGANFVLSNGGKVHTIPLTPGYSTTNSIAKMIK